LNLIYDPTSTVCAGSTCTRQAFPGNIIPAAQLNPVGLNIAATYGEAADRVGVLWSPNLTAAALLPARASQKTAKLDHEVTSRWRASLSYLRYFSLEPGTPGSQRYRPPTSGASCGMWMRLNSITT